MTITFLFIFGLATWRVASMFVNETGPFNLFLKIREFAGISHVENEPFEIPDKFLAQLLSCVWCASVWVGMGWAILWLLIPDIAGKLAMIFSFSAIAILIESYITSK
jgi:hypothetical protein